MTVPPGQGSSSRLTPSGLTAAAKKVSHLPGTGNNSAPDHILCDADRKEFTSRAGKHWPLRVPLTPVMGNQCLRMPLPQGSLALA